MPPDFILKLPKYAAIPDRPDTRKYDWQEIGFALPPFDWSKGYDVEEDLAEHLSLPFFSLPIKHQNGSGSCGGQSDASYGGVLSAFFNKKFVEMSAKFPYSQCFAPVPGGGTYGIDLCKIAKGQGWSPETLCVSYDKGYPPSEAFMERPQDISDSARHAAKSDRAISYADVPLNIDTIAQAIQANKGARIGIHGSNNGTWLSPNPQPPKATESVWNHFMYFGKARMFNGKKQIGGLQSWGPTVGDKGWQWIDEEYVETFIFGVTTYVFNDKPIPPSFKYNFTKPLQFGDTGPDVIALQTLLQIDGEFPASVPISGLYGNITRQAVLTFQQRYQVAADSTLEHLQGKTVGPATLKELNLLAK